MRKGALRMAVVFPKRGGLGAWWGCCGKRLCLQGDSADYIIALCRVVKLCHANGALKVGLCPLSWGGGSPLWHGALRTHQVYLDYLVCYISLFSLSYRIKAVCKIYEMISIYYTNYLLNMRQKTVKYN